MTKGKLYLIPVPLGQTTLESVLPEAVRTCAKPLNYFIAENAKSARAFLKSLPTDSAIQQIDIRELNEHTSPKALPGLIEPILAGTDAGLICLNGPPGMDLDMQIELFEQALVELDTDPDLVNQVLEITLDEDDNLRVLRYALPAEES